MSLSDNERNALVDLYWEKSKNTMDEARATYSMKLWSSTANRLYYAMFHALKALFVKDKKDAATHHGMRALLGNDYVRTGLISSEQNKVFSNMETLREKADYDCCFNVSVEEIDSKIPLVEDFLKRIAELIGKEYKA